MYYLPLAMTSLSYFSTVSLETLSPKTTMTALGILIKDCDVSMSLEPLCEGKQNRRTLTLLCQLQWTY